MLQFPLFGKNKGGNAIKGIFSGEGLISEAYRNKCTAI